MDYSGQNAVFRLQAKLERQERSVTLTYDFIKEFFSEEMNTYMMEVVNERWEFSKIPRLLEMMEKQFKICYPPFERDLVIRYINVYLQALNTSQQLEKALEKA